MSRTQRRAVEILMRLSTRLILSFLAVGLIPFGFMAYYALERSEQSLSEQCRQRLATLRENKQRQVEDYLRRRQADLAALVDMVKVLEQEAFQKLQVAQQLKRADLERHLAQVQSDVSVLAASADAYQAYIKVLTYEEAYNEDNQSLNQFSEAFDPGSQDYQALKKVIDPFFQKFAGLHGYEDIYIIDAESGLILYSKTQGPDLATRLAKGKMARTALAELWRRVVKDQKPVLVDFRPYAPKGGAQAAFAGAPVKDPFGRLRAVAAVQMSDELTQAVTRRRQGMGRSGGSYLIGSQKAGPALRSDLDPAAGLVMGAPLKPAGRPYLEWALGGKSGLGLFSGNQGRLRIVAWDPVKAPGLNWALVSAVDLEEAIAPRLEGLDRDVFGQYAARYGYQNLLLIDGRGRVFYSANQQEQPGRELLSGPEASGRLGRLFSRVAATRKSAFSDFPSESTTSGQATAYLAQPVLDDGRLNLVVALGLPLTALDSLLRQESGPAASLEARLYGPDGLPRTGRAAKPHEDREPADRPEVTAALQGRHGLSVYQTGSDRPRLAAYAPLEVFGQTWALVCEMDQDLALAAVTDLQEAVALAALIITALIVLAALYSARTLVRGVTRPIRKVLKGLARNAAQLTLATGRINRTAQSLAQDSDSQAAALDKTQTFLDQMSSVTRSTADNSAQAHDLMADLRRDAAKADQALEQASQAIGRLGRQNQQIEEIVSVITGLASQTNLLALNAAVEAARAGSAGASFAVVADEVRSLAQRSAEASARTAALLSGTVQGIADSGRLISQARNSFAQANTLSQGTAELVARIAQANSRQAAEMDQLGGAVGDMAGGVQRNAANAQQAAAIAEILQREAAATQEMVTSLSRLAGIRAGAPAGPKTKNLAGRTHPVTAAA